MRSMTAIIATTMGILTAMGLASAAWAATAKVPEPAAASAPSGKMTLKLCGAQWRALGDAEKAKYTDQAKTQKSAKGGKLSGYNVYTKTVCFKKG